MVRNKLGHFVVGTLAAVAGVIGSQVDALGPIGRSVCLLVAAVGALWALVIGHAPFIALFFVGIPFSAAAYIWRNPIRSRAGNPTFGMGRVAAFACEADRLLVVTLSARGTYGHAIHRRRTILERARTTLVALNVSEFIQDGARLQRAVARWNQNQRLLDAMTSTKRAPPPEGRPWIDLVDRSRASVDRVYYALDVLRGCIDQSERDDAILLALWYADACDEAYGKRDRSHWDRIVLEA